MKKICIAFVLIIVQFQIFAQKHPTPIHVEVYGKGQPIIFIPGFTVPGEIWMPTVEKLKSNYECHVLTLAGFAGKTPIEFPWLPKVNSSIEEYISENNLDDVIVIGHSLGGTIGTWLASRSGNSISKLIIVDALPATGALMIPNFNPDDLIYGSPYNTHQLEMDKDSFEQMAKGMAMSMSLDSEAQNQIKDWILQADRKTYVYGYTDYLKLDMREDLTQIDIPVSIIAATKPYGEHMASQTYKTQYENLKQYELIFAKDAAHFVMLDQPEWFMAKIEQLLSSH